jgi:glutathione peroxidase
MNIYDFEVNTLAGTPQKLTQYRGQMMLIVNVASKCGFTPQYRGLEDLYRKFKERGFTVLGFPCNQFGAQEPGDAKEIQAFCSTTYDVTFPLFAKIAVNGPDAHPLYVYLKSHVDGTSEAADIEWNFTKFLVDKDGRVIRRYRSKETPEDIAKDVAALL